jgi:hypothetical protein
LVGEEWDVVGCAPDAADFPEVSAFSISSQGKLDSAIWSKTNYTKKGELNLKIKIYLHAIHATKFERITPRTW